VSDNVEKRFEPDIYIHTYIHTTTMKAFEVGAAL